MRKNKKSRLVSLIITLASLFSSNSALAQWSTPVYGPPQPPSTGGEIIILLLLWLSFILIPIAVVIGGVIYFLRRKRKNNAKEVSEIRKPQNLGK
jgi:hypothetical protein